MQGTIGQGTDQTGNPRSHRDDKPRAKPINQSFMHLFETGGEFSDYCEVHPVTMRDAKILVLPAE